MSLRVDALQTPAALRRMAVLRDIDRDTHEALADALPALAEHLPHAQGLAMLADLLSQVAAEAADAAQMLARRLAGEPALVADGDSLRKWAVHGLQRHKQDAKRRLHHFEWSDPAVFADGRTEHDSVHLLARRAGLLHYLAGFGVVHHGIELHEPQDAKLPPPAPAIGDDLIRVPRRCDGVAPDARELLYRATMAHAAAHLRHSPLQRLAGNRRPMLLAVNGLIEDARVERLMVRDHPGLQALWGRFHTATRQSAGFDYPGLEARLSRALHDPAYADDNAWVQKGRTMFEDAAKTDLHDVAAFDRIARHLSIDIGKMRLGLPKFHRPAPSYRDDNALLWNRNGALPEDDAHDAVIEDFEFRPRDEVPPDVRHADVDLRRRVRYPEWDHQLEALRDDWATVIESLPGTRGSGVPRHGRAPRHRLHGLERTPDRAIRLRRLHEGDELDLDAAIDSAVHQRARLAPDGRIFRRHGRRRRATAIVLLMDLSASTERFVPGSFTSVIDVEKQAATLVACALDDQRDRVAVHGFASNGRHEVNYQRIKDFDEPFEGAPQARLASLTGALSTRMGAALRHAAAALHAQSADHKVILLLTDGEPSDVDVVEEDYLVEDARHAVASAAGHGIRTFCLTLDRQADRYVHRIFGARNYLITDRAAGFAGHTGQTLVRLVAQ